MGLLCPWVWVEVPGEAIQDDLCLFGGLGALRNFDQVLESTELKREVGKFG